MILFSQIKLILFIVKIRAKLYYQYLSQMLGSLYCPTPGLFLYCLVKSYFLDKLMSGPLWWENPGLWSGEKSENFAGSE